MLAAEGLGRYAAAVSITLTQRSDTAAGIATDTGLSVRTVHRHLRRLAGTGLVRTTGPLWPARDLDDMDENPGSPISARQMRSLRMKTCEMFAVVSRDGDGLLHVTAHTDFAGTDAARSRVCREVLGRTRGPRQKPASVGTDRPDRGQRARPRVPSRRALPARKPAGSP